MHSLPVYKLSAAVVAAITAATTAGVNSNPSSRELSLRNCITIPYCPSGRDRTDSVSQTTGTQLLYWPNPSRSFCSSAGNRCHFVGQILPRIAFTTSYRSRMRGVSQKRLSNAVLYPYFCPSRKLNNRIKSATPWKREWHSLYIWH